MFAIKSLQELESLSHSVKWQYFEKLVAFICEENGFDTEQNVVMKTKAGKRQFDVVAKRNGLTLLAECKKWKGMKEARSAIAAAARKHMERCLAYAEETNEDIFPIIVTLIDEGIETEIPVVPIIKLNWFLNNYDKI